MPTKRHVTYHLHHNHHHHLLSSFTSTSMQIDNAAAAAAALLLLAGLLSLLAHAKDKKRRWEKAPKKKNSRRRKESERTNGSRENHQQKKKKKNRHAHSKRIDPRKLSRRCIVVLYCYCTTSSSPLYATTPPVNTLKKIYPSRIVLLHLPPQIHRLSNTINIHTKCFQMQPGFQGLSRLS